MKRTELKRFTPISLSKSPIRKVNTERLAKRRKRKPKLKAAVRKEALRLADYQCTYVAYVTTMPALNHELAGYYVRCPETESLHVHEKKYPADVEDCVVLCEMHHMQLESQLRPWNRGRLGR
jgi:hypothetical protein